MSEPPEPADPPTLLCSAQEWGPLSVPDSDCPNVAEHEPEPSGYLGWFDWAAAQARAGRRQRRCPGCGLFAIWTPPAAPSGHAGGQ